MNVLDVLDDTAHLKTFLIGFYGGGNYGDELLLEVLANLYGQRNAKQLSVAYQDTSNFSKFHKDFGYVLVPMRRKKSMITAFRRNDAIVIGGGGLWGLDVNLNVLLLSIMLFLAKKLLRKKVYLIGVGYYSSTTRMGHVAAWFAAKAATHIVARDKETLKAFSRYSKKVSLDKDIAWNLRDLDLARYENDIDIRHDSISGLMASSIIITIRRFRGENQQRYYDFVEEIISITKDRPVSLIMMEPKTTDKQGFQFLKNLKSRYENVSIFDFDYNPVALFSVLNKTGKDASVVAPQFHMILTAHLAGLRYAPLVYDNNVGQLLDQLKPDGTKMHIGDVSAQDVLQYMGSR